MEVLYSIIFIKDGKQICLKLEYTTETYLRWLRLGEQTYKQNSTFAD